MAIVAQRHKRETEELTLEIKVAFLVLCLLVRHCRQYHSLPTLTETDSKSMMARLL